MSATAHDETYPCQHCGDDFTPATSVRGSFCSATCSFRQYGQQALRQLYSDHRFCGSCFRRIKTTSRPAENTLRDARVSQLVREAFVGYQSRTPHATVGVDEFGCIGDNEAVRVEGTRLSCECGTVDPQDRHDVLRTLDVRETVVALWHALVEMERTGALDQRPHRGDYFDAFREHGPDFEYAVGRALYAAPE